MTLFVNELSLITQTISLRDWDRESPNLIFKHNKFTKSLNFWAHARSVVPFLPWYEHCCLKDITTL